MGPTWFCSQKIKLSAVFIRISPNIAQKNRKNQKPKSITTSPGLPQEKEICDVQLNKRT